MMKENKLRLTNFDNRKNLACVGTGLITLDIIIENSQFDFAQSYAGGSCCNVLTILSYLGWKATPIGRITNDLFGKKILKDLKKWNVDTSKIILDESGNTPIIVEKLGKRKNGSTGHTFCLTCPKCGSFLPRFKPISARNIILDDSDSSHVNVFYFDRVSRGTINLAKKFKESGTIIFFEPPHLRNTTNYHECYEIADVVKFSDEKSDDSTIELLKSLPTLLLIETRGEYGLRYKIKGKSWKSIPAYSVKNFVDAAGAGDWCSAGFIHHLYQNNLGQADLSNEKSIKKALDFGQCLSSINCQFVSARGCMYQLSKKEFDDSINSILNGEPISLTIKNQKGCKKKNEVKYFCPKCNK